MKPLSMWRNKKQIKYAPIFRVTRLEPDGDGYSYTLEGMRQTMRGWRRGTQAEVRHYAEVMAMKATGRLRSAMLP